MPDCRGTTIRRRSGLVRTYGVLHSAAKTEYKWTDNIKEDFKRRGSDGQRAAGHLSNRNYCKRSASVQQVKTDEAQKKKKYHSDIASSSSPLSVFSVRNKQQNYCYDHNESGSKSEV